MKAIVLNVYERIRGKITEIKGGPSSGHWGHMGMGIPGQVGGSAPASAGASLRTGRTAAMRQRATKALAANAKEYAHLENKTGLTNDEWIESISGNTRGGRARGGSALDVNAAWNNIHSMRGGPKSDFTTFATNAYEITDPETGFHTKITDISSYNDRLEVQGHVYDPDGNDIGDFSRSIYAYGDTIEIHHDSFSIQEVYEGLGFGSTFYQNAENVYLGQGIDKVTVFANISVGGYAWARMGFDFDNSERLQSKQSVAKSVWESSWKMFKSNDTDPMPVMPTFTHAWELAAMKSPWDSHFPAYTDNPKCDTFGKRMLLGKSWEGVKYINPKAISAQVGAAYYESKKEKRKK